MIWKGFVSSRT